MLEVKEQQRWMEKGSAMRTSERLWAERVVRSKGTTHKGHLVSRIERDGGHYVRERKRMRIGGGGWWLLGGRQSEEMERERTNGAA
jgi:hypothetical protein